MIPNGNFCIGLKYVAQLRLKYFWKYSSLKEDVSWRSKYPWPLVAYIDQNVEKFIQDSKTPVVLLEISADKDYVISNKNNNNNNYKIIFQEQIVSFKIRVILLFIFYMILIWFLFYFIRCFLIRINISSYKNPINISKIIKHLK